MKFWSPTFIMAVVVLSVVVPPAVADSSGSTTTAKIVPLRLDAATLQDVALTPKPSAPPHTVLSGVSQPRSAVLFDSDSFVAVVFEEQPLTLALRAPGMPYDEYVHILDGGLILTDADGQAHEFKTGDSLVIPKGFTGTWETRGNFRELALVSRKDWDATRKPTAKPVD